MKYSEALDYLFYQLPMFQRQGPKAFKKDLKNIKELLFALDNPERGLKAIHIAGTNGKGTTAHLIASILEQSGLRVGLYTSPHYKDFRERIKINGQFIDKSYVKHFVQRMKKLASKIQPSFFEITVAMALSYFQDEDVDIAVIETGLGGRLDSTNVIQPLLSVITNIGMDHMNFLGNTMEAIAAEKAGIIKENTPVVVGLRQTKTTSVFRDFAHRRKAALTYAEDILSIEAVNTTTWHVIPKKAMPSFDIKIAEPAPFFIENMRCALAAIIILNEQSAFNLSIRDMFFGLSNFSTNTSFMGRWEKLNTAPLTIADSAHNIDAIKVVLDRLLAMKRGDLHFVLGFVKDKNLTDVLPLFPNEANYYFSKAKIARGKDREELRQEAKRFGLYGKAYSTIRKAYAAARSCASEDDLIFIGGSIFTVAEVL